MKLYIILLQQMTYELWVLIYGVIGCRHNFHVKTARFSTWRSTGKVLYLICQFMVNRLVACFGHDS